MTTPWTTPRALCGLMVGLFVLAVWGIGVPQTVSAQIGAGSCSTGLDDCSSNSGSIGNDSCNGEAACSSNSGNIGNGSCNDEDACERNTANIGDDSCNDEDACLVFFGDTIGNDSCNGSLACDGVQGNVGANSCNGSSACEGVPLVGVVNVGANSCNGHYACYDGQGNVGANSCNGDGACTRVSVDVGDCQNNTVSVPACDDTDDDDVPNDKDTCPDTPAGEVVNANGCSIAQLCPCENNGKNYGQYVSCVSHAAEDFVDADRITEAQKDVIVSEAGYSSCGKKKK